MLNTTKLISGALRIKLIEEHRARANTLLKQSVEDLAGVVLAKDLRIEILTDKIAELEARLHEHDNYTDYLHSIRKHVKC